MGFDQLYPADHHPAGIRNVDKLYGEKIEFKDIKFPVKAGEIHKIEGKNSTGISVFGYEIRRNIQSMDQKKNVVKINMLIYYQQKKEVKSIVFIKYFNIFMYDYRLYCRRKHFRCYCLQDFRT